MVTLCVALSFSEPPVGVVLSQFTLLVVVTAVAHVPTRVRNWSPSASVIVGR